MSENGYKKNIDALFFEAKSLPVIDHVVQELIASFSNEDVSADYIVSRIVSDPVLSAKLLRRANSAYFKVTRQVATVFDAMHVLGFVNLRTQIIGIALTDGFKNAEGIDLNRFWRYSLHTAVVSRYWAKQAGINPELAFTIGLMHAIGHLVMYLAMPQAMQKIEQAMPLMTSGRAQFEQDKLGYSYAEVGAELARRWSFPETFAIAIAGLVNPVACEEPLAALVHLAAWRAQAQECGLSNLADVWPAEVAALIGLSGAEALQSLPDWEVLCEGLQDLMG
jgi:HD-like signal output (HDOD) protein